MTPDDDDDKVRRNLVTFSSIAVWLALFEVPVQKVADKFFGVGELSELTVWITFAVMWIYLLLRFRFQDTTLSAKGKFRQVYSQFLIAALSRCANRAMRQSIIKDALVKPLVHLEYRPASIPDQDYTTPNSISELSLSLEHGQIQVLGINGNKARFDDKWPYHISKDAINNDRQLGLNFTFSRPRMSWEKARAFSVASLFSKPGLTVILPYVLASLALVAILWKLYNLLPWAQLLPAWFW
nr:hypothetical protein [uncultured Albidiferax sp.]